MTMVNGRVLDGRDHHALDDETATKRTASVATNASQYGRPACSIARGGANIAISPAKFTTSVAW